ncbi:MAG: IPT/TIG domain-containing protein, partial [Cyclobacteriaceae bacterium]|nr:IPT/TIG domain-containing protein [Cyclobacteriaceae bacterium]
MRFSILLFILIPVITWAQPPTITDFSPASGAVGATIEITGTDFSDPVTVEFFNGVTASATVNSSTSITATVPASAADGPISVTTSGGSVASGSNFIVLETPTLDSFTPTSGAVGAAITINGTNLETITNLVIGGQAQPTFTANATSITTTVPAVATVGLNKISFTTSGVNVISTDDFTVLASPNISSFTPASGASGAALTINGSGFGTITNLVIGGQAQPTFTANATSITTTVPAGAIVGPNKISFTTSGVNVISTDDFTVLASP